MSTDLFKSGLAIPGASRTDPRRSRRCVPATCRWCCCRCALETRFFTLPTAATELRVRVFPDKIHLDSHELDLTADEQTWGQHYWQQDWFAGNDTHRALRMRGGKSPIASARQRAAWIVRVLTPTNATQRPTAPIPSGQTLAVAPAFPTVVDRK